MLTANEISSAIARAHGDGRSLAVISAVSPGATVQSGALRMLVAETGQIIGGTLGDPELDELSAQHAQALIGDDQNEIAVINSTELPKQFLTQASAPNQRLNNVRLLFEISRPPLELIICGGGHVGQALARVAALLDFKITVIDDRAEFSSREKFPDPRVQLVTDDFAAAINSLKINSASHVVIVTRGHRHDEMCLREVIKKSPRYLGMIGSRRRTTTIREHLRREGIEAEFLRRVHAPIGLDIGAQTPEEIAVAVMAEVILVRRGGSGAPKSAEGPMAKAK